MRQTIAAIRSVGMPMWVLIGAVLGVLAGLVLGERTKAFAPVGAGYTMLLEIAIYPYLICALLLGLGRLAPGRARRLLRASWPVYVFLGTRAGDAVVAAPGHSADTAALGNTARGQRLHQPAGAADPGQPVRGIDPE